MTQRQSDILFVAARTKTALAREAKADGREIAEGVSGEHVRILAEDVASTVETAHQYDAARFIGAVVRQVEDWCEVRRGWWRT